MSESMKLPVGIDNFEKFVEMGSIILIRPD